MQAINASLMDTHGGLRRRQSQRAWRARTRSKSRAAPDRARMGEEASRAPAAEDARLPRDLARRREGRRAPRRRSSRSTVRHTCRASSRPRSSCRPSMTSTSSRTTSVSSRSSRTASCRASTSRSAAAWARRTAMPRPIRESADVAGFPAAGAVAGRGGGRAHDAARLRQPRGAQARASQVHDRGPRHRVVRRGGRRAARVLRSSRRAPSSSTSTGDRFGWTEGFDGRWHLTLRIEAGRVADTAKGRLAHGPA